MNRIPWSPRRTFLVSLIALAISGSISHAGVGDTLATITVPVPSPSGIGIGIAVDCSDPVILYYTNTYSPLLHKMTATGSDLGSVSLVDAATGLPISFGAIAWDNSRGVLWAGTDNSGAPVSVYRVDPSTGMATYVFTTLSGSYGFCDGLAYDGSDDTLYVSDDVSNVIDHWSVSGTYLRTLTPTDASGNTLGAISGVLVGKGDLLYLGQNGRGQIVQVKKSDGTFLGNFATPGGRDEDLECDVVSFPGKTAVWSKDAYNDTVTAIEVEAGTCACGGGGVLEVPFDIKPTSCPNPLNPRAMGLLPAAVLGTMDLDVTQIDPTSLLLEGVAPLRWAYEDVATPFTPYLDKDQCNDCNEAGPDGHLDLTLKFSTQELVMALGSLADGECRVLTLTGTLLDGTAFLGVDVMVVRNRLK